MHLSLILFAIALAILLRLSWRHSTGTWSTRWQLALSAFLLPPLLLLTTAVAVVGMGRQGTMLGLPVGYLGYLLGAGFLGIAISRLVYLTAQGWRSQQQVQGYPLVQVERTYGRLLDVPTLFAAQIGFWQPTLVISRGLLTTLTAEQVNAVLTHEQAHRHYRDTFWFFGLGWLRQLTLWLPNTEALWQELLLLRELRADRWAVRSLDPLVLAESLLLVIQSPLTNAEDHCAAFNALAPQNRLEERIDALLSDHAEACDLHFCGWDCLSLLFMGLPLVTMIFHH